MSYRPSAAELAALIVRCQSGLVPALSEATFRRDYVDKLIARAQFAVRRDLAGALAGVVAYYADQPSGGFGFVTLVAVGPEQRGCGLATAMMLDVAAACRARHLSEVRLMVNEGNAAAIKLYEGLGYVAGRTAAGQLEMSLALS